MYPQYSRERERISPKFQANLINIARKKKKKASLDLAVFSRKLNGLFPGLLEACHPQAKLGARSLVLLPNPM